MASVGRIEGDFHIAGALSATSITIPSGTVTDNAVQAAAGIQASKLQHQFQKGYAQESDTAASAEDRVIHTVYGATGTVVAFEAGSVVVCVGDATITIDLHKNGASILTTPIVLDSSNAAYVVEAGTISSGSIVDGDVLEIVITVNAGTGTLGKGVFTSCVVREDAN